MINDSGRGEAHKMSKSTAINTPFAVSLITGNLAMDNFKDVDVICWSKRGKVEARFCLKQALGEAFFHGLDIVNSLESENLKLQQSLTNSKASSDYFKGILSGAKRKIEEINDSYKSELKNLQDELEKVKTDAKATSDAQAKELAHLKMDNETLKQGKDRELSDAFSLGFGAYLQNFLSVNPEYDWARHFLPSTPAYIVKFKEDNAAVISKAKEKLEAKIASEKADMDSKRVEKGENTQRNGEETAHGAPSNTVLS